MKTEKTAPGLQDSCLNQQSGDFQVFVKPAGADCNLSCQYCYYKGKSELYGTSVFHRMSDEILELYIIQHIEASARQEIFFSWHGGEPLMAGMDFFRKVSELQRRYQPSGRKILNGIQTNATLINEEWCRFLSDEGFYAGVSIDGPEKLHNKFRILSDHRGSYKGTLKGYNLLKKYNIPTELLSVVNAVNVNFPEEVYRYLKDLGSEYITFLPLVIRDPGSDYGANSISVSAESWGTFLTTIFDDWISHDIGTIKIQIIEEAARTAFDQEHTLCIFKKVCGRVPVVEHNGDFYSCDHFVDKEHLIGNVKEMSLTEMVECERQKSFGQEKLSTLPDYCMVCEVIDMCNGECPKNRFINTPDGKPRLNYLCQGYKMFFNHVTPFVKAIAAEWNKEESR